jgi:hypothetical protein
MKGQPGEQPPDRWLDAHEAAAYFGVDAQSIRRYITQPTGGRRIDPNDYWIRHGRERPKYFIRPEAADRARTIKLNGLPEASEEGRGPGAAAGVARPGGDFDESDRVQTLLDELVRVLPERDALSEQVARLKRENEALRESNGALVASNQSLNLAIQALNDSLVARSAHLTAND